MEGDWKQRRGKALRHWGKVMNDDLAAIAGKYEEFVGKLQEKYGIARDEGNRQLKDFRETIGRLRKSNNRLMQLQKSLRDKKVSQQKRAGTGRPVKKTVRLKSSG